MRIYPNVPVFICCLLPVALLIGLILFNFLNPGTSAREFLQALETGETQLAISFFGSNKCSCSGAGWQQLTIYDRGLEPNVAYLVGTPVTVSRTAARAKAPDELTRIVHLKLNFSSRKPYFLPLPSAYGWNISEAEFNKFLADPSVDAWKGFSLRLRPSLEPGLIKNPKPQDPDKTATDPEIANNQLAPELLSFLRPTDPGEIVTGANHSPMNTKSKTLPVLDSVEMVFKLTKSDPSIFGKWSIARFYYSNPIISANGKTFTADLDPHHTHDF
jgi:hypothetical protein